MYVSDFSAKQLWVFDAAGRSLKAIGRGGQGAGEFEAPTSVAIGPDGRLYVRDFARVSRFTVDPATGRLTRHENGFRGPVMADWRSTRATRFDSAGRLYNPAFNSVTRSRRTGYYLRYTAAGVLVDSLEVPAFPNAPASTAFYRLSAANGRFRTVVVLPRATATYSTPVLSLGGVAAIGVDRETGANTILRFVAPAGR